MKKLNKKGFTLVELLAVIVILALLMVVATRSIGTIMDGSKQSALKTEAQKVLSGLYQEYQAQKLVVEPKLTPTGCSGSTCCLGSYCAKDGDYFIQAPISKADGSITKAIIQYSTTYYVIAKVDVNGQIQYCKKASTSDKTACNSNASTDWTSEATTLSGQAISSGSISLS